MYCYLLFTKIFCTGGPKQKFLNLSRSDFKYPWDFGFQKKCRIPSDSDSESVISQLVKLHTPNVWLTGEQSLSALWTHGDVMTMQEWISPTLATPVNKHSTITVKNNEARSVTACQSRSQQHHLQAYQRFYRWNQEPRRPCGVCRRHPLTAWQKKHRTKQMIVKVTLQDTMGYFTFWLSPWLSLLAEPKTGLSWRWAKKWSRIFRLVSATVQSELLAQPGLSLLAQSKVRTKPRLRPKLIWTCRLSPLGLTRQR